MHLWDYAFELTAYILTVTSNPHILFGDQTGYQIITQIKPDISQYASFDFYSLVWHWDEVSKQKTIGRWFGVAETVGPIMIFWVLPISRIPITRSTIIKITSGEWTDINAKTIVDDNNKTITSKLSDISKYIVPSEPSIPFRRIEQTSHIPYLRDGDII